MSNAARKLIKVVALACNPGTEEEGQVADERARELALRVVGEARGWGQGLDDLGLVVGGGAVWWLIVDAWYDSAA